MTTATTADMSKTAATILAAIEDLNYGQTTLATTKTLVEELQQLHPEANCPNKNSFDIGNISDNVALSLLVNCASTLVKKLNDGETADALSYAARSYMLLGYIIQSEETDFPGISDF